MNRATYQGRLKHEKENVRAERRAAKEERRAQRRAERLEGCAGHVTGANPYGEGSEHARPEP